MIPYLSIAIVTPLVTAMGKLLPGTVSRASELPLRQRPTWNPFDILAILILVIASGIRNNVGTDFGLYSSIFSRHTRLGLNDAMHESPQEAGYTLFSWVMAQISDSPTLLLTLSAALTVIPFYAGIKYFSPNPAFSVLLYILLGFYLAPLNIVRQGIALGLNFYSLRYLEANKGKFIAINLIAASFHVSVIPACALQLICRKIPATWRLLFVVAAISVLLVVALSVSGWLQGMVGALNPRYETYLPSATGGEGGGLGTYLLLFSRVLVAAYSLSLPVPTRLRHFQFLLFLAIPLQASALAAPPVARIELYFSALAVIMLPAQIQMVANKSFHWAVILVISITYFFIYLLFFGGLVPYATVL